MSSLHTLLHVALEDVLESAAGWSVCQSYLGHSCSDEEMMYRRKIFKEITSWEQKQLQELGPLGVVSDAVKKWLATLAGYVPVPSKMKNYFSYAVLRGLEILENGAALLAHTSSISLEPGPPKLMARDAMAMSYVRPHYLYSMFEGAGLGTGGFTLLAAEIPALLGINIRMLTQIAHIYGFDPHGDEERILLLHILLLSCLNPSNDEAIADEILNKSMIEETSRDRKTKGWAAYQMVSEVCYHMATATTEKAIENGLTCLATSRVLHNMAAHLSCYLSHLKLLQIIPLAGAAVAMGVNLYFTANTAQVGIMIYRKRFLLHQHGVYDRIKEGSLPLPVSSYIVVEEEDDLEGWAMKESPLTTWHEDEAYSGFSATYNKFMDKDPQSPSSQCSSNTTSSLPRGEYGISPVVVSTDVMNNEGQCIVINGTEDADWTML